MFRLRDWSLPAKLYALVVGYSVLVAGVLVFAGYLMRTYRVHGPVYEEIASDYRLLNDMDPPMMSIGAAYLMLSELDSFGSDAAEIRDNTQKFRDYEAKYNERRAYWLAPGRLPEGEIRRGLEGAVHTPAADVFRIANEEYLPLIGKGPEATKKANEILNTRIRPKFYEHRRASVAVVEKIRAETESDELRAYGDSNFWASTLAWVSVALVVVMGLTGWWVATSLIRTARELRNRVREMASGSGDLHTRLVVPGADEMGQLAEGINGVMGRVQAIVAKVRESSLQLLTVASQIAATARRQEQTVQDLSASTVQVAASVREISATSQDLSGTMNEVNESAGHAADLATRGRDNTNHMAGEIRNLLESTVSVSSKLGMIREKADRINAVVTTITKVADQTNLLSINAAIEAEKAGEYGRGFLVVAREIRRLADQTAVATLDIETMVRQMQDAVSAGVMQMDKFADEVRSGVGQVTTINQMTYEIITEVTGLSDRFQLVTEGMKNQAAGAQQINDAMGQIAESTKRNAQSVQEFERATEHLRASVEGLNQEIVQFKI
ncbi:methyl-accepting chemotaxis protein [Urbifossiella limnaea]|uniref:Methyl-accepting chemotaxis protein 4 n=1 Tax=Urbifossiella limnaea TaxID=2528023 RepID=A0A517XYZ7_9BACT|nr:methyl-accepting chemotaxis protein [Urbifossiella limnaea]QDU22688.1 Methyl-accepting chemotaxis protein 4 [Urbifossiella limnaea]